MIGALILTQQNMKCRFVFMCTNKFPASQWWENMGNAELFCWIAVKILSALQRQTTRAVRQAGMRCCLVSFPRSLSPLCYYLFLKILYNSFSCYQGTGGGQRLVFDALSATGLLLTKIDQCQVLQAGKMWWETVPYFRTGRICFETWSGICWSLCFWSQGTGYKM